MAFELELDGRPEDLIRGSGEKSESHAVAGTGPDERVRALVGERGWMCLPSDVRRRFSKSIAAGQPVVYQGAVITTSLSRLGKLLAFAAKCIGSPLPLNGSVRGPAVVTVIQDQETGDQFWIRTYDRIGHVPQIVLSQKRFRGPTGLEEYIGYGIGMTLRVKAVTSVLTFTSERYFLECGRLRFYLPNFVSPGRMTIRHAAQTDGSFLFELSLDHRYFGQLLHQIARFEDAPDCEAFH